MNRGSQRARRRRRIGLAIGVVALLLGAGLLYRTLSEYDASEIARSVTSADAARLVAALGFAAGSYLCLSGFDGMALRYVDRPLAWRRVAWASFTSLSIGHNIGFAVLSSGAIRYRFYTRWGLRPVEVGKVIVFCGITVMLGLVTLAGGALVLNPTVGGEILRVDAALAILAGVACLVVPVAYVLAAFAGVGRLRFRQWVFGVPSFGLAVRQVALGTLNFMLVAGCLHQTIDAVADASYAAVATAYVLSNILALISHVPGGLGVIEGSVLYLLPGAATIAGVLLFRVVYFLVPLALGLISFVLSELLISKEPDTDSAA